MPYNATQLGNYYAALTGNQPTGADAVLLNAYATQSQGGTLSDTNTLLGVFNSAGVQATFEVAESTYQFFTGSGVSAGGLAFLEGNAGSGNAQGLNTAYYSQFNTENRYYNFAINLASAGGAGNASFVSSYATLTFAQTVATAYEAIVGSANVGTAAANAAIAAITADQAYFTQVAQQRAGGIDAGGAVGQNIALKAIAVGYILEEANKADVGTYAKAIDQLEASVAANATSPGSVNNPFGVNILTTFGASGSGFNTGFTALGTNASQQTSFALTTGIDTPMLTTGNVNYIGTVSAGAVNNNNIANNTTLQAGDRIIATGANNTLTVTAVGAADATGGAVISGVQTIDVREVTAGTTATFNAQGNTAGNGTGNVSGTTALYSYLSNGAVTFTNVSTQAVGIINDGITTGAALTANYVTSATSATVNLAGGTTAGETVTLAGTGLVTANINSNGGLNQLATLTLPNTVTTLNLAATSPLTLTGGVTDTGLTTLTASGSNPINVGTVNSTVLTSVNTTGLTSTGALTATFTAAPAAAAVFSLGAGSDILTFNTGLTNNNINLGGGSNSITVNGGLVGTTIIGGQQSDVVTITGGVDAKSVINTGGGGDLVQAGTAVGATAANIAAGASINGGGGATFVTDSANFAAISAFTPANRALITGFSTVGVDDRLAATTGATYDINAIGAQNFTTVGVAAGNTANLNVATGAVVTFTGNLGGFGGGSTATAAPTDASAAGFGNTGTLNIGVANASATTNSVLNLGFTGLGAGQTGTPGITTTNVQTINVTTSGTTVNSWGVNLNGLVDAALTNINIFGNKLVTYNPVAAHTALTVINGSAATGNLTIDATALPASTSTSMSFTSPLTISSGAGNDVLTVKDFAKITTGAAIGATGFDTIQVATTSSGQTYSSVMDAHAGDHIIFGTEAANTAAGAPGGFTAATGTVNVNKIVLQSSTAVFQDYLDAATGAAHNTAGEISAFDFGGNTYLVENATAGGAITYQNGQDSVIQLAGIHTVATTSAAGVVILGS